MIKMTYDHYTCPPLAPCYSVKLTSFFDVPESEFNNFLDQLNMDHIQEGFNYEFFRWVGNYWTITKIKE